MDDGDNDDDDDATLFTSTLYYAFAQRDHLILEGVRGRASGVQRAPALTSQLNLSTMAPARPTQGSTLSSHFGL